ncbi:hypothetical protein CKO25_04795 [Thiocapsa imhoffii]|uniref:Slp family lipoprotein n=1 Tax=Thiocapsa imhoffii TaxID=382777 RepID=A0A9X1B880_9GAMM|nr:Slp/YeaY family lipoprotein [Thiocapsa imhoffii]MBK1643983.1 hypothetical protein [Thiocapsa imhoffii]
MPQHAYSAMLATTLALVLLGGCASSRDCVGVIGASGLTPDTVVALGQGEGAIVTWGGVIARAHNRPTETDIETIGYPLDRCGRPVATESTIGRFILVQPGFLEPTEYRQGRQLTATGRIAPAREGDIGATRYSFPVLDQAVVRLWPEDAPAALGGWTPRPRPWFSIGLGNWNYRGVGGGIGVSF